MLLIHQLFIQQLYNYVYCDVSVIRSVISLLLVSVTFVKLGPSFWLILARTSSALMPFDSAMRSINNLKPFISKVFLNNCLKKDIN